MISNMNDKFKLIRTIEEDDNNAFTWLEWSPDGEYLALASNNGGSLCLWEHKNSRLSWRHVGYFAGVNYVKWSRDSRLFASGCVDGTIRVHQIPPRENDVFISSDKTRITITGMDWSPNSHLIAIGGGGEIISFWSAATGEKMPLELKHSGKITGLSFSPDGKLLAASSCCGGDGVCVWDVEKGKTVHEFHDHSGPVSCVTWSPNNAVISSCGYDSYVYVRDLRLGGEVIELPEPQKEVICVDFSSDGNLLAAASLDDKVRIWSSDNWELVAELDQQIGWRIFGIGGLAFHPSESILATLDSNGKIVNIWNYDL